MGKVWIVGQNIYPLHIVCRLDLTMSDVTNNWIQLGDSFYDKVHTASLDLISTIIYNKKIDISHIFFSYLFTALLYP